jgi:hypothetical protein
MNRTAGGLNNLKLSKAKCSLFCFRHQNPPHIIGSPVAKQSGACEPETGATILRSIFHESDKISSAGETNDL